MTEMMDIHDVIQCEPTEQRVLNIGEDDLSNARRKIENHIFSTIVRDMKIPIGHDPVLQCWMSLG